MSVHVCIGSSNSFGTPGQVNGTSEDDEKEADFFAREALIPSEDLKLFVQNGVYNTDSLKLFAEHIGTDTGILVGRLQHDGIVKYNQLNNLKTKYEFNNEEVRL